jgi:tungstate transport system permease protein
VSQIWAQFRQAIPLITHGNPYIIHLVWVTLKVVAISTGAALVIGLPIAVGLALGRFRGRRTLLILANAGLALPPVVVGVGLLILTIPRSAFHSLGLAFTLDGVYVVQAILALPYVVVLSAAALQALPTGLLTQARMLGANRRQVAWLAIMQARIGILAAVIAAAGVVISEVGAVAIIGGNIDNYDQTLASALLVQFNFYSNNGLAIAIGLVLLAMILVLTGGLTLIQQRSGGVRFRLRLS